MGAFIDLTDKRFGRLRVIGRVGTKNGHPLWKCHCDCGSITSVVTGSLRNGLTTSCGCFDKERRKTHGESKSRLYYVWLGLRQRCYYPHHKDYKEYGGRGIKVCDEWLHDFTVFRDWAMAAGYDIDAPYAACTLDRIDVNRDYSPSNCRWVDAKNQANNRRPKKKKGAA